MPCINVLSSVMIDQIIGKIYSILCITVQWRSHLRFAKLFHKIFQPYQILASFCPCNIFDFRRRLGDYRLQPRHSAHCFTSQSENIISGTPPTIYITCKVKIGISLQTNVCAFIAQSHLWTFIQISQDPLNCSPVLLSEITYVFADNFHWLSNIWSCSDHSIHHATHR